MTRNIEVAANEHGVLRLFSLSMPPAEASALRDADALAGALGLSGIDTAQTEVIALVDIGALGLASYLTEGMGARAEEVRAARSRLDALEGHALILRSAALPDATRQFTPDPRLTLIATLHEEGTAPPPMERLHSESARGTLSGGTPGRRTVRRGTSRPWLVALAVAAVLLILALILILR